MSFSVTLARSGMVPGARTDVPFVEHHISFLSRPLQAAYRKVCTGVGDRITGIFSPHIPEIIGGGDAGVVDTALSTIERDALTMLAELMRSALPHSKRSAILLTVFTKIRSPRTFPFMRKLLAYEYEETRVRKGAAHSLGQIGTDEAYRFLCDTFTDTDCDTDVRKAAAWAIGDMKIMDARRFLMKTASGTDEFMGAAAREVLSSFTSESSTALRVQTLAELSQERAEQADRLLAQTTSETDELTMAREELGYELYAALEPLFEG